MHSCVILLLWWNVVWRRTCYVNEANRSVASGSPSAPYLILDSEFIGEIIPIILHGVAL